MSEQIIKKLDDVKPGDKVKLKGGYLLYECLDNISDSTEPGDGEHWHLQISYDRHPWETGNGTEWVDDSLFEYAIRHIGKD